MIQIEWTSCLGFAAKVLNAPGKQIHLDFLKRLGGGAWSVPSRPYSVILGPTWTEGCLVLALVLVLDLLAANEMKCVDDQRSLHSMPSNHPSQNTQYAFGVGFVEIGCHPPPSPLMLLEGGGLGGVKNAKLKSSITVQ